MHGKEKLTKLAQLILSLSQADETEVVITASDFALTRFANNQIHQNVARNTIHFSVRAVVGKKTGVAAGDDVSRKGVTETVWGALELAKHQRPDPDFPGLPQPAEYKNVDGFDEATASASPQRRAEKVKRVINVAISDKLSAFGALSSGVTEFLVANSKGVRAYFLSTQASFNTTMMADQTSGYGADLRSAFDQLEIGSETEKAVRLAAAGKKPRRLDPGEYEVVIGPAAVNEMLTYLAYLGFGARAFHEDRSFLSGKLGQKVLGAKMTLWDDGLDPKCLPLPFDFEGVPRRSVCLMEKGVAKAVVYDSYLAAKYHQKNSGHGLAAPNTIDALAGHLHVKPGPAGNTEEKLIAGVKKGLYINRFWYVNCHHHKSLTITGLTRDGTFWIENGRPAYPVMNLRFTQSIVEALRHVVAVGGQPKPVESWLGANSVPALCLKSFRFTGVSELVS